MPRRFRVAVLGGTFDRLHVGHQALLDGGLTAADQLGIGITSDRYLDRATKPLRVRIQPFAVRQRALVRYLTRVAPHARWWVVPLEDGWGGSVEPGVDAIVATEETAPGVASANRERRRRGLSALAVVTVPLVRGDDGLPVSSRRIRAGSITPGGHRTRVLPVGVAGAPRELRSSIEAAFVRVLPHVRVKFQGAPTRGRPVSGIRAAERAASLRAVSALRGSEYGVGLTRVRSTAGSRDAAPTWMLGVQDAEGPVAPPMLVAHDDWARALSVVFADRRPRRRSR